MSSKPTVKEIEEYMTSLNIPLEQGLNGTTSYDVISKPKHYMLFSQEEVECFSVSKSGIEVRDVIEKLTEKFTTSSKLAETTPLTYSPLFSSDYVQLMQYLMRFMDKNGKEDLQKARFYLDKMIEAY